MLQTATLMLWQILITYINIVGHARVNLLEICFHLFLCAVYYIQCSRNQGGKGHLGPQLFNRGALPPL